MGAQMANSDLPGRLAHPSEANGDQDHLPVYRTVIASPVWAFVLPAVAVGIQTSVVSE
ncbi:hypothetical protein KDH_12670 [Dictyobacter sp. S3.2.2.5]|uniref:Uncharacterized protein n=1 Tax=Dictyobacter halimunensis TaxID=3026934 RepID=A0ABQ6FPH0_9CHLR|nr:hypothetical protein KDH_12670 [Dictyobacter sp. S3.2.2.5]